MRELVGAEQRLQELSGDDDLLGYVKASATEQGVYYLALRTWPHPDLEDGWTLSLRYAYLTRGDGSDGWTDEGVNMRVEGDRAEFLQALAQMCAGSIPRLDGGNGPTAHDVTEE